MEVQIRIFKNEFALLMITITMKGLGKVDSWMANIKGRIPRLSKEMAKEVASSFQKSAKLRAKKATGYLANSIIIQPYGKDIRVSVNAPYGVAQELGFKRHLIPIEYIFQHLGTPGMPGQWVNNPSGFVWVSKSTPFIMPALDATTQNLPNIARRYAARMVKK